MAAPRIVAVVGPLSEAEIGDRASRPVMVQGQDPTGPVRPPGGGAHPEDLLDR